MNERAGQRRPVISFTHSLPECQESIKLQTVPGALQQNPLNHQSATTHMHSCEAQALTPVGIQ